MGLGDLCMDDPEPKIAMPDWAGGGSSRGVTYDEEREKLARELCEEEPMESEAPDACAPAPAPGPAPAIDDDRVHEPTDPELIQLNGLLQARSRSSATRSLSSAGTRTQIMASRPYAYRTTST